MLKEVHEVEKAYWSHTVEELYTLETETGDLPLLLSPISSIHIEIQLQGKKAESRERQPIQ